MKNALKVPILLILGLLVAEAQADSLAELEMSLAAIEGSVGIAGAQKMTAQNARQSRESAVRGNKDVDAVLDKYYEQLQKWHESESKAIAEEARRADAAAKKGERTDASPGKKLEKMEDTLAKHRVRLEAIVKQITEINMDIHDGSIMLDPKTVKALSKEERSELQKWLAPDAIKKYRDKDRSLFVSDRTTDDAAGASDLVLNGPGLNSWSISTRSVQACSQADGQGGFLVGLGDLLVPRAEAALAAGCVATCYGSALAACAACVGAAIGTGAMLTVELNRALKRCNSYRWSWSRRACKAATILSYSVLIA